MLTFFMVTGGFFMLMLNHYTFISRITGSFQHRNIGKFMKAIVRRSTIVVIDQRSKLGGGGGGLLRAVQQPGSYIWGKGPLNILSLLGFKPTHRGDSLWLDVPQTC